MSVRTTLKDFYHESRSWDPIYQAALAAAILNVLLTLGITVVTGQLLWIGFVLLWIGLGAFVIYIHR